MNYSQSQKFLLNWAKLGRKEYMNDPKKCSVYLERLQYFLNLIGNPEQQIPHYIHVTGTSGKGSVCLMLDAILRSAGKKVGAMTSPDTGLIQTRWQINDRMMNKIELAKILTELKPKLTEYLKTSPYDPISYFELLTAIGLYYFAKHKIEWCILEVGLGGRYDSTNVIPYKDIAVITNIGLDHTDILGKTKTKIAYEKAGIIKRGNCVFTAEQDKKVLEVIQNECTKQKTLLKISDFKFQILEQKGIKNRQIFKYKNNKYQIPVSGEHQIKNAILCIEIARSLKIPYNKIKRGLEKIKLPLRMEIISKKPLIILDGAHNPDKMETTVNATTNLKSEFNNLHLLIGFSADKDIDTMIKQLAKLKPQSIACTRFTTNPFRTPADPKSLTNTFKSILPETKIKYFSQPKTAFNWSKNQAKLNDIILVTGSLYLSGELRQN